MEDRSARSLPPGLRPGAGLSDQRARRLALVVRRALLMIVKAIEDEFGGDPAPIVASRGTIGETK